MLRGLAVILVIAAHAVDSAASFGQGAVARFYYFENFGAIGVDIFFIISGVIMTVITAGTALSPKQFFLKRCIRILPLYWAVSFFCWLISFAGYWPQVNFAQVLQTITLVPVFTTGYFSGPVLFLGWTLAFEFFFYLLFTLSMFFNKKQPLLPVSGMLLSLVAAGFIFPAVTAVQFKFVTNPIVLEFLAGCICGYLYLKPVKIPAVICYAAIVAGVTAMGYSVISGFGNISEMEYTWNGSLSFIRVVKWGIPSFLLVTGLVLLEKNNQLKVPGLAIVTGDISYSAYLSHFICIMFATKIWYRTGLKQPDVFIVAAVIFCLVTAYVIYRFIEKPLTRYLNKKVM